MKCPFCDKGKKTYQDIKVHIREQHYWRDHWARWITTEGTKDGDYYK